MANDEYVPVATDEDEKYDGKHSSLQESEGGHRLLQVLGIAVLAIACFSIGYVVGGSRWSINSSSRNQKVVVPNENGLLPPQSLIPESRRLYVVL